MVVGWTFAKCDLLLWESRRCPVLSKAGRGCAAERDLRRTRDRPGRPFAVAAPIETARQAGVQNMLISGPPRAVAGDFSPVPYGRVQAFVLPATINSGPAPTTWPFELMATPQVKRALPVLTKKQGG
jgi:hypothetical protein